jgi:hypothetical protein
MVNWRRWDYGFLFFMLLVLSRFFIGIRVDGEDTVWTNFNFVDTAFHMSLAQAFLKASQFPPTDPNLAGFPLKYHFISNFSIAHLARLGMPLLDAVWWLNMLSAAAMSGAAWVGFKRWLKLPSRWVLLACLVFFFSNLALVNLIHFCVASPAFFNPGNLIDGILFFPYFNFESIHNNLIEPQRGLAFVMPVIFTVLAITQTPAQQKSLDQHVDRKLTLFGFYLVCLLPLAHIVSFAVLGACLLPKLIRHREWLYKNWAWLPALAFGLAQLTYIMAYGPSIQSQYTGWDVGEHIPLRDFSGLPAPFQRLAFWFAVNGDFFFWGAVFTVIAIVHYFRPGPPCPGPRRVREFGRWWAWYFMVCIIAFIGINYYRYTANWGDSNKFIFFLNMGLTVLIVLGAAQWIGGPNALRSRVAWWFFFIFTIVPTGFDHAKKQFQFSARTNVLFHHYARDAADWIKSNTSSDAVFLTAAGADAHFLTALAARSARAGIYVHTNPYLPPELPAKIRRFYEEGDLVLLDELDVDYICLSVTERNLYSLHPRWDQWINDPSLQVFSSGEPTDRNSVFILDARRLSDLVAHPL